MQILNITRYHSIQVIVSYVTLVVAMWAWYGLQNGLPYETLFVYVSQFRSQTGTYLLGFLYQDPLRLFLSTFYHLSYLLSILIGQEGSFITYQIVYAVLWFGRGFLAFLIIRRLFPDQFLLAYLVGVFVIVHAADGALNWVGQLNQFGFIFLMLLSFYLFINSIESKDPKYRILSATGAIIASFWSLWSYESQILLILFFPITFFIFFTEREFNNLKLVIAYYIVPIIYLLGSAFRYVSAGGSTYQESVLRTDFSISIIFADLLANMKHSLAFWGWAQNLDLNTPMSVVLVCVLGAIAAVVFGASGAASQGRDADLGVRQILLLFGLGLGFLMLSYPAYLLLEEARSHWRTQFLSGFGTAILLAGFAAVSVKPVLNAKLRSGLMLAFGVLVVGFGTIASLKTANYHYEVWNRHRNVIAEILKVAPRLIPETVLVLKGVSKYTDAGEHIVGYNMWFDAVLGHNMWFDIALRLAYPETLVAGIYRYTDGAPAPGSNMIISNGKWRWTGSGFPTLLRTAPVDHTLVIELDETGHARVARKLPPDIATSREALGDAQAVYDPSKVILSGPPSPLAVRRYGPIGTPTGQRLE